MTVEVMSGGRCAAGDAAGEALQRKAGAVGEERGAAGDGHAEGGAAANRIEATCGVRMREVPKITLFFGGLGVLAPARVRILNSEKGWNTNIRDS
jgi:hypothetical protein